MEFRAAGTGLERKREAEGSTDGDSTRAVRRRTDEEEGRPRKRSRAVEAAGGGGDGEGVGNMGEDGGSGVDLQGLGDPTPWLRDPSWLPTWMHRRPQRETSGAAAIAAATPRTTQTADTAAAATATAAASASAASAGASARDDAHGQGLQGGMDVDEERCQTEGEGQIKDRSGEHTLMQTGPMVFCSKCGAYAINRVGARLAGECHKSTSRATRLRLERMRQGLHPMTGDPVA